MLSTAKGEANSENIVFFLFGGRNNELGEMKLITLQRQNINFSRAFTQWKLIKVEKKKPDIERERETE